MILALLLLELVLLDVLLVQLLHRLLQKMLLLGKHLVGLGQLSLSDLELHVQRRDQLLIGLLVNFDLRAVLIQPGVQSLLLLLELLGQALVLNQLLFQLLAVLLGLLQLLLDLFGGVYGEAELLDLVDDVHHQGLLRADLCPDEVAHDRFHHHSVLLLEF